MQHALYAGFSTTIALLLMSSTACDSAEVETVVVTADWHGAPGAVLRSRLVVRASHVLIDGHGATLEGAGDPQDPKSMESAGVGIILEGCVDVTVRNLKVRHFATGLLAKESQALVIESCDVSDNYHNPRHGWGELPARGGFLLQRTHRSVIRSCHANRVWDALHLVDSDDNLIEDSDCSHCSNTCGKLWHSSRNRFLRNNFSYGIRIDRAAGEVHARDSTSVLIEAGSDDNYWFRNDMTQGGDGLFIRVLNGWVSRGNVFIENDTSHANNNCIESWSPGNTYLRNKANHGSYGFWLGGSDQTTLIGNEAAYNGLTNGNHNAPEPGFSHGGIVVVGGPSSHTRIEGNWCHHNNGGGIVFRGDAGSQGRLWRTRHWVVQQNRLEENRWGIWGQWGDDIWIAQNRFVGNARDTQFESVSRLRQVSDVSSSQRAPVAILNGPSRAVVGQSVRFDASSSRSISQQPLHFQWTAGELEWGQSVVEHVFSQPGFYRLGLTVDDGGLADLAWRDLIVTEPLVETLGTEGQAARWGFELEGNGDGRGKILFSDDPDAVVGQTSLRFTPNPYPGQYATAIFPATRDADWELSGKKALRFWIRTINPNLPGFQNAGPVLFLYTADGFVKWEPAKGRNLFVDLPFSEARWSWMPVTVPLSVSGSWTRTVQGSGDLHHVKAVAIALDSWGGDPFTVWLDGLAAE